MKLSGRRKLRSVALQILYKLDLMESWHEIEKELKEAFSREKVEKEEDIAFIEEIVKCVVKNRVRLDKIISSYLKRWDIDRLNVIERNILRIGTCELLFLGKVSYKVAINEAVELAKIFGAEGASGLVNGVLDKIAREKGVKK